MSCKWRSSRIRKPERSFRGAGGVRKLRWALPGRGKRGGLRVIYYLRSAQGVVWMLTLYPKNVAENIPARVLRKILKEIEGG